MQKKAQVTLFIILGLIILLFAALFFTARILENKQLDTEKQIAIHTEIEQCIESLTIQGIRILSSRGGFYEYPENYVIYALEDNPLYAYFPYYYMDQKDTAPTKEELEEQFEKYLLSRSDECYENLEGVTLSTIKEDSATISIGEKSISVDYDPGIAVVTDDEIVMVQKVRIDIPSSYYIAYSTAVAIAREQNAQGNTFCISCLAAYSNNGAINNVKTEEIALSPYYAILYMNNFTEQSRGESIAFMFAGRYALGAEEEALSLSNIKDQEIIIGYNYNYKVLAQGKGIAFSDNTDLFDINATTGEISFYPDQDDVGTHLIEITATDAEGNSERTLFYLNITEYGEKPLIESIAAQSAAVGEEFTYKVNALASGAVYFTDDTEVFDIDAATGNIAFTPTEEQRGTYNVTITAITEDGASAEEKMVLVVY